MTKIERLVVELDDARLLVESRSSWSAYQAFGKAIDALAEAAQRIRHAAAHESAEAAGEQSAAPPQEFVDWFAHNYPKNTEIFDPLWHAPRIYRSAVSAYKRAAKAANPSESCPTGAGQSAGDSGHCCACERADGSNHTFGYGCKLDDASDVSAHPPVREQAEPVGWMCVAKAESRNVGATYYGPTKDDVTQRATYTLGHDCAMRVIPLYADQVERAQVPREPTEAMIGAAVLAHYASSGTTNGEWMADALRAAYDAALPAKAVPPREPADEMLRAGIDAWFYHPDQPAMEEMFPLEEFRLPALAFWQAVYDAATKATP